MLIRSMLLLFSMAFPALAAEPSAPGDIELPAQHLLVKFSAEGRIEDIQYQSEMVPAIRDVIRNAVRGWSFQPVLRDGKAVPSAALLVLRLKALSSPDGANYRLKVVGIDTSSWVDVGLQVAPKYPPAMARSRRSARLCVEVRISPDGRMDATGRVFDVDGGGLLDEGNAFAQAARDVVPKWSAKPIIIDGVNYSPETRMGVFLSFRMKPPGKGSRQPPAEQPAGAQGACPANPDWNNQGPQLARDLIGTML